MHRATHRRGGPVALLLLLSLFLSSLCACAPASSRTELHILTERTTWDRMNGQLYVLERVFEAENPDVDIVIDYLPSSAHEREVYVQRLRTQILRGEGPDAYVLPTDSTLILNDPVDYTYVQAAPLFPDVSLAMQNGIFYDMSALFDRDTSLAREQLNMTVLDAGVLGGRRYVLPLRYDMPVLYACTAELEARGLDASILSEDILTIMQAVYESGDAHLAGGLLHGGDGVLSAWVDYETGEVALGEEELCAYMRAYQNLCSLLGETYTDGADKLDPQAPAAYAPDRITLDRLDFKQYIYCEYEQTEAVIAGTTEFYPLWLGSMQDVFDYASVAQYEQIPLTVIPLTTAGGTTVATVSCYAAIGAGCRAPERTYDFLKLLLSQSSQWESNRPQRDHTKPLKGNGPNNSDDLQYPGLIERGWPVMDANALQDLWKKRRLQVYILRPDGTFTAAQRVRMSGIGRIDRIELASMPVGTVDSVRFDTVLTDELQSTLRRLNDPVTHAPTGDSIEELARTLLRHMRRHIGEG